MSQYESNGQIVFLTSEKVTNGILTPTAAKFLTSLGNEGVFRVRTNQRGNLSAYFSDPSPARVKVSEKIHKEWSAFRSLILDLLDGFEEAGSDKWRLAQAKAYSILFNQSEEAAA